MKWLDNLLGRSEPPKPDLDALFALPGAALTLQAAAGFVPTGAGAVCYKAAEGASFAQAQADVQALLDADAGPKVELSRDSYGYTWLLARADPGDMPALVTDLHAVNSTLADAGFGPSLLCTLVPFTGAAQPDGAGAGEGGRRLALVYLYKQGTWYPFAPTASSGAVGTASSGAAGTAGEQRDNALELQVKAVVAGELRIEPDLSRWFPVWGAPGLC